MSLEDTLKRYLGAREPTARFASFDYCFNHFQAHRGTRIEELASSSEAQVEWPDVGQVIGEGSFPAPDRT